MAFVTKALQLNSVIRQNILCRTISTSGFRPGTYTYRDYKPGPYPKTKEERDAAAKKYGLLPEEYEPYPDDGNGLGDYPKLPIQSSDIKDPNYRWDDDYFRRDFGETMHADSIMLGPEKVDQNFVPREPLWYMIKCLSLLILTTSFLFLFSKFYPHFHPRMEKQYPGDKPHYTFKRPPQE